MRRMKPFDRSAPHDPLDLDGHALRLLLAVIDEGSVTAAAHRLGVTQSAVSHGLDRLRAIVGDPLFVKAGRGIAPTDRALALATQARELLEGLRRFAQPGRVEPATLRFTLTVAANDLQRDLLLPAFLQRLRRDAPGISLRVIRSGVPGAELLRQERCELVISPRPPDAADVRHKRLFEDRYVVFHDAAVRAAPATLDDYLAAEHVTVRYEPQRALDIDEHLAAQGVQRRFVVQVPGFSGIAPFVQGSAWLATLPSLLGRGPLRGLASAAPPLACPTLAMYLAWHERHQHDPLHRWLRGVLEDVVDTVVDAAPPGDGPDGPPA